MRKYFDDKISMRIFLIFMILGIGYLFLFSSNKSKAAINRVFNQETNEKVINKDTDDYKILIKYPITSYEKLDSKIEKFVEREINNFLDFIEKETFNTNREYQLIITYDSYYYNGNLSYVFYIFTDFGGAHPANEIYTVVYNKDANKLVNIESLITYNRNILNVFSKISREQLIKNERIVNTNMMMDGTRPLKDNFSNFVFASEGLIIFFETYQVAPYSSGEFQVLIDYEKLKDEGIIV